MALISIITPCYNSVKTIGQTIESVRSQTFVDWEMLIVDDCSTDNSADIIKSYCKKDNRVKYLKTETNKGNPSEPRNMALDNATGKYVAFLDSDDMWLPDKLEEQLNFMTDNGYVFVYSNYEKMSYDGVRDNRVVRTKPNTSYNDILASNSIPCLTAIVSRDIIENIRFKMVPLEDCAFWMQILKTHGITAHNTNQIHGIYRESKNSRSGNKLAMIKARWNLLRNVEDISFPLSVYFMLRFLVVGYLKYLK